jgi:hypothetical protein
VKPSSSGSAVGDPRLARALAVPPRALDDGSDVSVRAPLNPELEPRACQLLREHKLRGFGSVAPHLAFAARGGTDLVRVPFLAGNPLAHATAVASCRALLSRAGSRDR